MDESSPESWLKRFELRIELMEVDHPETKIPYARVYDENAPLTRSIARDRIRRELNRRYALAKKSK